jgi:hypothetical protein
MEINLQFDNEGRTRCSAAVDDYSTKAVMTKLGDDEDPPIDHQGVNNQATSTSISDVLDRLLQDCEIADSDLTPHTFWMPALSTELHDRPRCMLECMALQVFQHHVRLQSPRCADTGNTSGNTRHDDTAAMPSIMTKEEISKSGAEWWVQIRPSSHDHTATTTDKNDNDDDDMSKSGVAFHWDKDEELRHLAGGNLYVHPHISTVTYLTSIGAPTMVVRRRIHALTGDWIVEEEDDDTGQGSSEGYLSWPKRGKHLSFDGGYLHAAPANLLQEGCFEKQCRVPHVDADQNDGGNEHIRMVRRRRRVTFLVNIWLNHKPVNVERFPEGMLEKMSKVSSEDWKLFESPSPLPIKVIEVAEQASTTVFTWPMGCDGSNESISVSIPIDKVREMAPKGQTMCLRWSKDAPLVLSKGETSRRAECDVAGSDRKRSRTD